MLYNIHCYSCKYKLCRGIKAKALNLCAGKNDIASFDIPRKKINTIIQVAFRFWQVDLSRLSVNDLWKLSLL